MGAPASEQDFHRFLSGKEILLARLESLERDLDGSVERLDEMTREIERIAHALRVIDAELGEDDELLGAR
jgi:hypothetical protein